MTTIDSESGLDLEGRALCALRRYAERAGLTWFARLGNVHSPQRLRPVRPGPKLPGESIEKGPHRLGAPDFDIGDAHAVGPRGALVGGHVNPCSPHHIAAGELVEEGMEPTCPILLGAAIQHALKSSKSGSPLPTNCPT